MLSSWLAQKQDPRPQQGQQPAGDEGWGRQQSAARTGTEAGNSARLAASSRRSSPDGRRRLTPKGGGVPSSPGRSEDEFAVSAAVLVGSALASFELWRSKILGSVEPDQARN